MISGYEKRVINKLLDKYEKSKTFIGSNKVNQTFSIKVGKVFPKYMDDANYEVFATINDAVDVLVRQGLVHAKADTARVYDQVDLALDNLDKAYLYIGRIPKRRTNDAVLSLIEGYKDKNHILGQYYKAQYERIQLNKSIQFFNNDLQELENILIAAYELLQVETETFMRDFSVRVFKDSKKFELIASKVINLLFEFGEFPEKDQVLGSLNIIKNPTYVNFKGAGKIRISGQEIDLTSLNGDIAISSAMIGDIDEIKVVGRGVISIENLTSFHSFNHRDMFAVYLGGYHNTVRREFIKKVAQQNPAKEFYHFGDIDAGGFYILEHLKAGTGVGFKPYKMDLETLKAHSQYTIRLTENDQIRLGRLVGGPYDVVVGYMLENNCKLEQEAIN